MQRHGTKSLKCEICGTDFTNSGSVIYTEKDGEIGICPSCHDDVYQYGSRFDIDIMIVPVSEDSFKTATYKKKYICPSRYIRKRKPKFIAFYRGGDIGAITHVARVVGVTSNVPKSELISILRDQGHSVWMDENEFNVFDLSKPVSLKNKIAKNDSPPIQNRVYKTFRQFAKARKLRDLYQNVE